MKVLFAIINICKSNEYVPLKFCAATLTATSSCRPYRLPSTKTNQSYIIIKTTFITKYILK